MSLEIVLDIAAGVASDVRRRCPYVDHADLVQEAASWALRNPEKLAEVSGWEPSDRDPYIARALYNRLRRVAEKERAVRHGYRFSDIAWYSEGQIEDLLPSVYDVAAWTSPPTADGSSGSGGSLPSERGGWVTGLADVADAIRRLDQRTQAVLRLKHVEGIKQTHIAVLLDVSDATVSDVLSKAPRQIQAMLGGARPEHEPDEIGQRRAISNTHAQAINGKAYDGE